MVATFEVLAEPNRRRILDLLLVAERPVGDLVEARTDAQRRIYRVRAEPLRAVDEWLRPYRKLWSSRLDALEQHLETMDGGEGIQ